MPVNWAILGDANPSSTGGKSMLAEWGTFGVEFYRLSQLTDDPRYWAAADRMYKWANSTGQVRSLSTLCLAACWMGMQLNTLTTCM